jgi:hypothetical protein
MDPYHPSSEDEIDTIAFVVTNLLGELMPTLDKGAAYPIVWELFSGEIDENILEHYAQLIRLTAFGGDSQEVH